MGVCTSRAIGVSMANHREEIHDLKYGKYTMSNSIINDIQHVTEDTAIPVTKHGLKSQVDISSEIDEFLMKEKKEGQTRVKILLLGGADAGKTTLFNQMRILHMNGFSADELHCFNKVLRNNIFQIFHEIARGVEDMLDIGPSEWSEIYRFAEGISWRFGMDHNEEIMCLRHFSMLKSVNSFLQLPNVYSALPDNANYYVPILSKILSRGYTPTAEDVLHLRIPTTSIKEINFSLDTRSIRLIDVGGQRSYRKKWIHCFEGVAAVFFVASMAAYDQALEDGDKEVKPTLYRDNVAVEAVTLTRDNRLRDSAQLFADMLNCKFLTSAAFILFLNKRDLFFKKLPFHPLERYLDGYKGATDESAAEFIREYFIKRRSKKDKGRMIYTHLTCATDTKNVEFVFNAVYDIISRKHLKHGEMM